MRVALYQGLLANKLITQAHVHIRRSYVAITLDRSWPPKGENSLVTTGRSSGWAALGLGKGRRVRGSSSMETILQQ